MEGDWFYLVTLQACRAPDARDVSSHSGAYVNCWLRANTETDAKSKALTEVRSEGWVPGPIESVQSVRREDYHDDPSGREYFEQGLNDGVVLVFHTWYRDNEELQ